MHLLHAKYECGLSNAILSIFPMTQKWTFPLEVDKREARVLIGAELQISESFSLPVFNTHLDHVFEELRLLQMDIIHSTLKKILPNQPFHILGGDFNSINVEDYPKKKWNSIKEYRIKNSWELPFSDVYNRIVKDWKYLDTYRVTNQKEYPPPSCWAGTRIDYIFFSPEFNGKILKCETVKTKASDHQPILVEFEV